MIASGITFFIVALCLKEQKNMDISSVTLKSIVALLYLILVGSLVGYLAYMWLLSVRPASLVGTYAYVNPVVAVFLGWLFAGETISLRQAAGLGIIILGLVIVNISKEKKQVKVKELNQPHTEKNSIRVKETAG